jgi:hypothetical protein
MHHLIANEFKSKLDDRTLSIDPSIALYLESNNTRLPIDLTDKLSDITQFDFAGTFKAEVDISVEGIPVEMYISASSDDITTASSIDFEIRIDVSCENLPRDFADIFVSALDALETRVADGVGPAFDDIGLGLLGGSLLVHDVYDFKAGLFDKLFGTKEERAAWLNGTTGEDIDFYNTLTANTVNVVGDASLDVTCVTEPDRFILDLTVRGSLLSIGALEELRATLLPPQSFPSLGLNVSNIDVEYELNLPLSLYSGLNKLFQLGETQASLAINFTAAISESLPILSNENITFSGAFDFGASLSYSSIQGLASSGRFSTNLGAQVSDNYVGIRAQDDNIFDSNPRK